MADLINELESVLQQRNAKTGNNVNGADGRSTSKSEPVNDARIAVPKKISTKNHGALNSVFKSRLEKIQDSVRASSSGNNIQAAEKAVRDVPTTKNSVCTNPKPQQVRAFTTGPTVAKSLPDSNNSFVVSTNQDELSSILKTRREKIEKNHEGIKVDSKEKDMKQGEIKPHFTRCKSMKSTTRTINGKTQTITEYESDKPVGSFKNVETTADSDFPEHLASAFDRAATVETDGTKRLNRRFSKKKQGTGRKGTTTPGDKISTKKITRISNGKKQIIIERTITKPDGTVKKETEVTGDKDFPTNLANAQEKDKSEKKENESIVSHPATKPLLSKGNDVSACSNGIQNSKNTPDPTLFKPQPGDKVKTKKTKIIINGKPQIVIERTITKPNGHIETHIDTSGCDEYVKHLVKESTGNKIEKRVSNDTDSSDIFKITDTQNNANIIHFDKIATAGRSLENPSHGIDMECKDKYKPMTEQEVIDNWKNPAAIRQYAREMEKKNAKVEYTSTLGELGCTDKKSNQTKKWMTFNNHSLMQNERGRRESTSTASLSLSSMSSDSESESLPKIQYYEEGKEDKNQILRSAPTTEKPKKRGLKKMFGLKRSK